MKSNYKRPKNHRELLDTVPPETIKRIDGELSKLFHIDKLAPSELDQLRCAKIGAEILQIAGLIP